MSAERDEHLRKIHERSFVEGQAAQAQQNSAELLKQRAEALKAAAAVAEETIDLADQLAASGDPHKRKIAEAIKTAISGGVVAMANPGGEGREAPEAAPFVPGLSGNSPASLPSSPGSTKSLPQPEPPPKRGRGRPRKQS